MINDIRCSVEFLKIDHEFNRFNLRNQSDRSPNSIESIIVYHRIWSNQSSNLIESIIDLIESNVEFDLINLRHNTGKIYQSSKSVGSIIDWVARISCHRFNALAWIFMKNYWTLKVHFFLSSDVRFNVLAWIFMKKYWTFKVHFFLSSDVRFNALKGIFMKKYWTVKVLFFS